MKIKIISIFVFIMMIYMPAQMREYSLVNSAHLDKLYEDIDLNGAKAGMVHIYCDFPEYKWTDASGEGVSCVDDCVRAAIFYMNEYRMSPNSLYLEKAKKLTRFTIKLYSENGFFYNFVFKDMQINKTGNTSINEPNWWSWRALWGLAEAYEFFKDKDRGFADEIMNILKPGINAASKWLDKPISLKIVNGFELPDYLPFNSASDQAAIILKAFVSYYKNTKDKEVYNLIIRLCDGIVKMQAGSKNEFPHSAFLSWQTSWHAWGNNQAEALLLAYPVTKNKKHLKAALNEINNFYPWLKKVNYINEFEIEKVKNKIEIKKENQFSQIAYGITPMILACAEAYNVTGKPKYLKDAFEISKWFLGKNIAKAVMYHPASGGCFDGINDKSTVNKNMGAESTIEALFAMQALEKYGVMKKFWKEYYKNYINE